VDEGVISYTGVDS